VESQEIINILFGLLCAVLGWILKTVWQSVKDLQNSDKVITAKVHEIEVFMSGTYIRRDEVNQIVAGVNSKLDNIQMLLSEKANRE